MIKTTRYCDICGKEQHNYDLFFQIILSEQDINGKITLSNIQDICEECLEKIYWKISELKHPNRKYSD